MEEKNSCSQSKNNVWRIYNWPKKIETKRKKKKKKENARS